MSQLKEKSKEEPELDKIEESAPASAVEDVPAPKEGEKKESKEGKESDTVKRDAEVEVVRANDASASVSS